VLILATEKKKHFGIPIDDGTTLGPNLVEPTGFVNWALYSDKVRGVQRSPE
jgi:hypothetical protein